MKQDLSKKITEIKKVETELGKEILALCNNYKGMAAAVKILKEVGFYERSFSTNS